MTINTTVGTGPGSATLVRHPEFHSLQASQQGFMLYESFRGEIADFVDSIYAGRQPGATITHGLDILRVFDAIYRSAETGEEIDLHASTPADVTAEPGELLATSYVGHQKHQAHR